MQYSASGVALISGEYLWMLVAEALVFYLIAGPYVYFRRDHMATDIIEDDRVSGIFQALLFIAIVTIVVAYYIEVRHFLLFDLIAGKINYRTVLPYRLQYTYGLPNFIYYRLGFLVLPAILSGYTFIRCKLKGHLGPLDISVIIFCFIPQLLLSEKSGLLQVGLVILVALVVVCAFRGQTLYQMIRPKVVGVVFLLAVPTVVIWTFYEASSEPLRVLDRPFEEMETYNPEAIHDFRASLGYDALRNDEYSDIEARAFLDYRDLRDEGYSVSEAQKKLIDIEYEKNISPMGIMRNLWSALRSVFKRVFVVHSEVLALSIPFVEEYGQLGGVTLPRARGLFPGKQFIIEVPMHTYAYIDRNVHQVFSDYESASDIPRQEWFTGSLPVSALAEGYLNFRWVGFLLFGIMTFVAVILVQEVLWHLRIGLLSWTLMAWYGYLAVTLSMYSVFATFISLIHTGVLLVLAGAYWAIAAFVHHAMKPDDVARVTSTVGTGKSNRKLLYEADHTASKDSTAV
jgi:hypothetical protein